MPSYSEITKSIESFTESPEVKSPVGVFVGGTSGIGLHTAFEFAHATKNLDSCTIYIVGRDKSKADAAETQIAKLNPKAKVHFLQHDLTYIEQAKRVANIVSNHETSVDLLFLAQGGFSTSGRDETSEGIDKKMAVSYYTRWQIVKDLLPLLSAATKKTNGVHPARVITVLGAGFESKAESIDPKDFGMIKGFTFTRALGVCPAYNTMACFKFAREHKDISFIHTSPGLVSTGVYRDVAWYTKPIFALLTLFSSKPEVSGKYHIYTSLTGPSKSPEFAPGSGHILNSSMDEIYPDSVRTISESTEAGETKTTSTKQSLFSESFQNALWKHTEEVFENAVQLDSSLPSSPTS